MVRFYGPRRRMMFDEDASWLPPKNRPFTLKHPNLQQESEPKPEQKKTSDKEVLDERTLRTAAFTRILQARST